jgi:hypothetical protein
MNWIDEVQPDYEAKCAKLWRFVDPEPHGDPRIQTLIEGTNFLVYAPHAHPAWDWHIIMTQSLEDVPDVPPPILHYPGAEYEVTVWAVDPEISPPDPREWPLGHKPSRARLLQPPDAVVQFHGPKKEQVYEMMEKVAQAVSVGWLVPDSDHRRDWKVILQKTAEHYRGHPEFN